MSSRPRLLTIMGSGETAPTMAKVHRVLFERLGSLSVDAVLLDTPYGFQENADDITTRAVTYFSHNLGVRLEAVTWRSARDDPLVRERALARVRDADYVFAGPGSPTYALGVWKGTPLRDVVVDKLDRGGCITFSSAAALTLGVCAIPVYEIYKVGETPFWLEGLDVFAEIGVHAAVVPHYDNAEGGNHDTRFSYLGERRLRLLEPQLPAGAFVLGVDEHTACVFDLDSRTVSVLGRGGVSVRRGGQTVTFPSGSLITLDELCHAATPRDRDHGRAPVPRDDVHPPEPSPALSLGGEADRLELAFDDALSAGDVGAAVAVILELDQVVFDWFADMEAGDMAHARAVLRRLVVRLGDLAVAGARDPREVIRPFVDALVEVRDRARAARSWDLADLLRDRLSAAGVGVRDTAEGTVWTLE